MPLPPSPVKRTPVHHRKVVFEGFRRDDGLWDIEGHMVDTKSDDFPLCRGILRKGEAIHDMSVRVTIDSHMNVVNVLACSDASPYMGVCDAITQDYRKIIGLNLLKNFVRSVRELFGEARGCSHLNELLMSIPTAAVQTFANPDTKNLTERKPFYIDRCHALSSKSEVVRQHYPKWYFRPDSGA